MEGGAGARGLGLGLGRGPEGSCGGSGAVIWWEAVVVKGGERIQPSSAMWREEVGWGVDATFNNLSAIWLHHM